MMNQKGRSMIEMLGVLAIIGVLSVGGITGYSKAMYKYRMNKTIQTVTQMMQRLIELSGQDIGGGDGTYSIEITGRQMIAQYGFLPQSMCSANYIDTSGDNENCKLPLGEINIDISQGMVINSVRSNNLILGEFYITFFEGDITQSCIDFLSYGWQNIYPAEWLTPQGQDGNGGTGSYIAVYSQASSAYLWAAPKSFIANLENIKTNITLDDITKACDVCRRQPTCIIDMTFNNEL